MINTLHTYVLWWCGGMMPCNKQLSRTRTGTEKSGRPFPICHWSMSIHTSLRLMLLYEFVWILNYIYIYIYIYIYCQSQLHRFNRRLINPHVPRRRQNKFQPNRPHCSGHAVGAEVVGEMVKGALDGALVGTLVGCFVGFLVGLFVGALVENESL